KKGGEHANAVDLADIFCAEARKRIEFNFKNLFDAHDDKAYRMVGNLLKGEYDWLQGELVERLVPSTEELETIVAKMA
ncbi:MAG TPA: hypothetical protein VEZ11_16290, partial [Thermoanaerobaculia bacterium]|nr:hypothetical protein [Thermoanaerobaculia bacterium]